MFVVFFSPLTNGFLGWESDSWRIFNTFFGLAYYVAQTSFELPPHLQELGALCVHQDALILMECIHFLFVSSNILPKKFNVMLTVDSSCKMCIYFSLWKIAGSVSGVSGL